MISNQQLLHHLTQPNPFFSKVFNAWVFTDPLQIECILKNPFFSARREKSFQHRLPTELKGKLENLEMLRSHMLFFMDGEEHALLRKKTVLLIKSRYKNLSSNLDRIWKSKWKDSSVNGRSEIMGEVVIPAVKETMALLLGCTAGFTDKLEIWSKKFNGSMSGQATLDDFIAAEQAVTDALFAINEPANQKWVKELFLNLNAEFSSSDKKWLVLLLFMAGFDTSVGMLSNAIFEVSKENDMESSRHSGQPKHLIQSSCPVNFLMRESLEDISIYGCDIKKGDRILISLVGANQHVRNGISGPLDNAYAFGFGNHSCIGQALAIAQLKSCLDELRKLKKQPRLTKKYSYNDNLCFHYPDEYLVEWKAFQ